MVQTPSGGVKAGTGCGWFWRERGLAPYLHVHRADLQGLLRAKVAERANVTLRLGARVESVDPDGPGALVRLADGEAIAADAVIGCDGLRSAVRQALWGAGSPRFTGMS